MHRLDPPSGSVTRIQAIDCDHEYAATQCKTHVRIVNMPHETEMFRLRKYLVQTRLKDARLRRRCDRCASNGLETRNK